MGCRAGYCHGAGVGSDTTAGRAHFRRSAHRTQDSIWFTIEITLLKVVAFIVLMVVVGRKAFLAAVAGGRTGSREIFTLCVIAGAVTVAFLASKLSVCRLRLAHSLRE